ncbi:MAG TPA: FCD domain-containing protein [Actinomycetes bacterium]|jgi:DNA-binding FadR family transcriptional regulator|nr:FCD domain-containing protein [Actinomycetes bacterium]
MTTSPFRPVSIRNAFEAVIQQIAATIDLGLLAPGDRLPAERELAILLGVSRPTVREALRVLVISGYVAVRRGAVGGAFVLERPPERSDRIRRALRARREELLALLEWRRVIEAEAAALAAVRADEGQLRTLAARLIEAAASLERDRSLLRWRGADSRFHIAVAEACGNPHLGDTVRSVRAQLAGALDVLIAEQAWEAEAATGHLEILAALQQRDPSAARSAALRHGQLTEERLRAYLGDERRSKG